MPNRISKGSNYSQFYYGPKHERYKQVAYTAGVGTETTIYVGKLFEQVTKPSGVTEYKHYLLVGDAPVALVTRRSNGTTDEKYFHRDHLGNLDTITDGPGNITARLSYDAFGKRREATGWTGPISSGALAQVNAVTHRGFTDHESLDAVDVVHMNGRVYDPIIGRFLSPDPLFSDVEDSQALNPYSYVRNNPLSFTDPSGFLLKGLFRDLGHFLKKWGGTIAAVVLTMYGMPYIAAAVSGALNTAASGGNLRTFARSFAIGIVASAIAGPISARAVSALDLVPASLGAQVFQGSLSGGIAGGITAKANGESFKDGFFVGAATGAATAAVSGWIEERQAAKAAEFDPTTMTFGNGEPAMAGPKPPDTYPANATVVMDGESYWHIYLRHVFWPLSNTSRYAPEFGNDNALNKIFDLTMKSSVGLRQPNGNYAFTSNLPFALGTNQLGVLTSQNTVIVKLLTRSVPLIGRVVTMYPGFP